MDRYDTLCSAKAHCLCERDHGRPTNATDRFLSKRADLKNARYCSSIDVVWICTIVVLPLLLLSLSNLALRRRKVRVAQARVAPLAVATVADETPVAEGVVVEGAATPRNIGGAAVAVAVAPEASLATPADAVIQQPARSDHGVLVGDLGRH